MESRLDREGNEDDRVGEVEGAGVEGPVGPTGAVER